jgi:mono/diheme cytochrome c family protein
MFKAIGRLISGVLVLVGLLAVIGIATFAAGGISARSEPGKLEMAVAPKLRSIAIPASAKEQRNPLSASADVLAEGMEHFADHCSICHGNDGSGNTEIGRSLYPRVPDMRKPETQNLSDGELYYIIQNGVRLTGMPSWAHEDANDNWKLVHFIRHQPKLTPQELKQMEALNPKSHDDEDEKKAEADPARPAAHTHKHPQKQQK